MNGFSTTILLLLISFFLWNCKPPQPSQDDADMVIYNGSIYTMEAESPIVSALSVKEGKIAYVGNDQVALQQAGSNTTVLDLKGKTLTPGLIESHAHIMGLGQSLIELNLSKIKNYDEMVEMVEEAVKEAEPGEWILGRGWHQSKWDKDPEPVVLGYQTHHNLSAVSPDNPVFLRHASGHAGFANAKAMEIAGIDQNTRMDDDGEIIRDKAGDATGVFTERAEALIAVHIPEMTPAKRAESLELAIKNALEHGITSFQDAGSSQQDIDLYEQFLREDKLNVNLWVMLAGRDSNLVKSWYAKGPKIDPDGRLTVRAIKLYADGALGSRGAWLLAAYEDRINHFGNAVMPMEYISKVSHEGLEEGFQVCTHAIGDRANREVLDRYEAAFQKMPDKAQNSRFRIEHAQHLSEEDIPRFSELGVIPAMQGIHMASDRPWAIFRLGQKRILEGAYVWQKLYDSGAIVINGTDAPVEPINPIPCFYASVTRKTLKGEPEGGYEADQAMNRTQALRSYTLDAAYGAFEEDVKGSIKVGKRADFTVFDQDIMTVSEDKIMDSEVIYTIVGGDVKYARHAE